MSPSPAYSRLRALDAPKPIPGPYLPSIDSLRENIKRAKYRDDPVFWCEDKLGESLWSKQREMLESVRDKRRTAVHSCHRIGKSFLGGRIAFWWLDTHEPGEALVVTSAHSATQVKLALWREMSRVHARGKFPGRMNQTEYWMPMPNGTEEMVAFGRKPAENDPGAFQGTYSKYVLFILDEACYVPESLWDGADTLIGNEFSRMVAFGNPDDPNTEFGRVCRPNSGWNIIGIGYLDTPNFTNEDVPQSVKDMLIGPTWVEEKRKKWGEASPLFTSKVLGKFPENADDTLIPLSWIRLAQERWDQTAYENEECYDIELGCDVGGGNNKNVIYKRKGRCSRLEIDNNNPDTMATLECLLLELGKEPYAKSAKIDAIGIGHGASDRAKQISADQTIKRDQPDYARRASLVIGVEVGRSGTDPIHFANYRAEGFWHLRELFKEGNIDIDPADEMLAAQLSSLKYFYSSGRIQIESKRDMKEKRKLPSPDRADALMLAFLVLKPSEVAVVYEVSW